MTASHPIYALYAGFRATEGADRLPDEQRPAAAAEAQAALESTGATVRGIYTAAAARRRGGRPAVSSTVADPRAAAGGS
jgi:hypothetical protein